MHDVRSEVRAGGNPSLDRCWRPGGTSVALAVTMSRYAVVLVLVAISTSARADPGAGLPSKRIDTTTTPVVGGTSVPPGKWPDAVAVLGAQGSCTGTLIAPDVVITAGHCSEINPSQIIANTTDYTAQGGTTINVLRTVAYPNWQTTYDVSVVVLAQPVTGVSPRKLGTSCTYEGFSTSTNVHLVGFGLTDAAGMGNNTALNEATTGVTDPECSGGNGCNAGVAPGGEFVAGGAGTDSCFGDSGGPVYLDTPHGTIVIGAVSRGVDNSPTPCGAGGIYVRTDKIITWLEQASGTTVAKDDCSVIPPGEGGGGGSGGGGGGGSGSAGDGPPADVMGGCSTTGGGGAGASVVALAALLAARRRRTAR